MRRAADGFWEITGDTATHALYGVGPASDYATNRGTTLRAPWAGVVSTYTSGTGGLTIAVDGPDATWFGQHNNAYYMTRGHADESDPVAASGNTGTATTGPHSHQWVIDNGGNRHSFEEWIAIKGGRPAELGDVVGPQIDFTSTAGGGTVTPINETQEDDVVNRIVATVGPDTKHVAVGQRFYQGADMILYPFSGRQIQIDGQCNPGARWTEWSCQDIEDMIPRVGLANYHPDVNGQRGGVGVAALDASGHRTIAYS